MYHQNIERQAVRLIVHTTSIQSLVNEKKLSWPIIKYPNVEPCTVFYLAAEMTDLGNASDSDVDPLGGVHRGAGHSQGHRVQGHPATTNQIYSDTFILYCGATFL